MNERHYTLSGSACEPVARSPERPRRAPQHLHGPKFGIHGRAWLVHCLRSTSITTFEPPQAASWAFQSRTAWRVRSSSPMGGDIAGTCDEASWWVPHSSDAFGLSGDVSDIPRSPGLRLVLALEIERHCCADEILQGRLIDLVTFVDVDGAPDIPLEAGVE